MNTLAPIAEHECEHLLRAAVLGRIVLPTPGRTEVFPVNNAVMGNAIVVRTAPGSLLDRYADGAEILLEVDEVDHERWHGWSVVARGRGERVEESELTSDERGSPGPPSWVPGREICIRIHWREVTGRKLGAGDLVALPVRRVWR